MQATRAPGRAPWRAAFIRSAKLNPYRRHHRQSASLLPPHEQASGQAGGASGDPRATATTLPCGLWPPWRAADIHLAAIHLGTYLAGKGLIMEIFVEPEEVKEL